MAKYSVCPIEKKSCNQLYDFIQTPEICSAGYNLIYSEPNLVMMGARPRILATSFGKDSFSKVASTRQPGAAVTRGEAEIREIQTKHTLAN